MSVELKELSAMGVWSPKNGDVVFITSKEPISSVILHDLTEAMQEQAREIQKSTGHSVRFIFLDHTLELVNITRGDATVPVTAKAEMGAIRVAEKRGDPDGAD